MYSICKKKAKHLYLHLSIICQKVSKLHLIFSKSLKTVTMISVEASIAHQEKVLHNSAWEVKFQMLLQFKARNNHVKVTQGNATQLLYSWVRNVRQLYKKDPQPYDPLFYKRLTELVFEYSLNNTPTTFSDGVAFLRKYFKQNGHRVAPTQYPQNQQLVHWAKYLCRDRDIKSHA
jgi:hypothetical protein